LLTSAKVQELIAARLKRAIEEVDGVTPEQVIARLSRIACMPDTDTVNVFAFLTFISPDKAVEGVRAAGSLEEAKAVLKMAGTEGNEFADHQSDAVKLVLTPQAPESIARVRGPMGAEAPPGPTAGGPTFRGRGPLALEELVSPDGLAVIRVLDLPANSSCSRRSGSGRGSTSPRSPRRRRRRPGGRDPGHGRARGQGGAVVCRSRRG
jgi:hypothetical protein